MRRAELLEARAQIRLWPEGRGGVPIYKLVIALMEDGFKPTWLAE